MALRKMRKEHHIYRGLAKELKKWVNKTFTSENQYKQFVEAFDYDSPDVWLSELGDIVKEYE